MVSYAGAPCPWSLHLYVLWGNMDNFILHPQLGKWGICHCNYLWQFEEYIMKCWSMSFLFACMQFMKGCLGRKMTLSGLLILLLWAGSSLMLNFLTWRYAIWMWVSNTYTCFLKYQYWCRWLSKQNNPAQSDWVTM